MIQRPSIYARIGGGKKIKKQRINRKREYWDTPSTYCQSGCDMH